MLDRTRTTGFLFAALSAAFYGTNPAFAVPLYNMGMNPLSVLLFRYMLGVPILALLLIREGNGIGLGRAQLIPVAAAGICLAVSSLCLYESYLYMNPGVASTLLFMYPVLTALLMTVFFREKFRLLTAICLLIMGIGLYFLMVSPEGVSISLEGTLIIFFSSLTYAIYLVMMKVVKSLRNIPTVKSLFYQLVFGSFLFVFMVFTGNFTPPQNLLAWNCLLGLALVPTILSLLFTIWAVARIGPTPTAIFGALEPVTAVVLSIVILGQAITLREIFGGILIMIATLIVMLKSGNKES